MSLIANKRPLAYSTKSLGQRKELQAKGGGGSQLQAPPRAHVAVTEALAMPAVGVPLASFYTGEELGVSMPAADRFGVAAGHAMCCTCVGPHVLMMLVRQLWSAPQGRALDRCEARSMSRHLPVFS